MENQSNSRLLLTITSIFVVLLLISGACSAGFVAGRLLPVRNNQPTAQLPSASGGDNADPSAGGTPQDLQELFVPFWQAWNLVHEEYVDQPVDDSVLMRGAIRGMLDALGDPHTSYLDPEEFKILNTSLQGDETYEGIGAWVDTTGDFLTIISPMPGSPAEKAGLRTGDKILAIDGEDMSGLDGEVVRKKVLGPADTTILLSIARQGQEPFDVSVTRANITVPSLEYRMLDNNIGYVRIFIFADTTSDQLREALTELMAQKPSGIILDLRGNGGGYLEAAVEVGSQFLDKGVVLYEEYGDGSRKTFDVRKGGLATDIPIVVLINEGTASASEIVAGAIQDTGRGKLVGVTSFGKGSVQLPTTLENEAGAVRITIARWLTPNGRTIHGIGLTPDVEVLITDADFAADRDPQLDKAVEILMDSSQ
jgi:carboxyl-terminal processing protease